MNWLWFAINLGIISDIYSRILSDETCQLYFGYFDWPFKGKFESEVLESHTGITLAKCTSKCVHFKGEQNSTECMSINYHPTSQECEVLGEEMKDYILDHIFVGPSQNPKYKPDMQGWLHYSGNPSRTLYGPTCSAKKKEMGGNPCIDGICIDSCNEQGYFCYCDINGGQNMDATGACTDPTALNPCYLMPTGSEASKDGFRIVRNSYNQINFEENGNPQLLSLSATNNDCSFSASNHVIRYNPKKCSFDISQQGSVVKTLYQETCAYRETEKLVGNYDLGRILKSKFGLVDGFIMQPKGLAVVLTGNIKADLGNSTFDISAKMSNMFTMRGHTNCTVRFQMHGRSVTWTKQECQ